MESAEELTITTVKAFHCPDREDIRQGAKVCFLVNGLGYSQSSLLIEMYSLLYSDEDRTLMHAESTLAQHFRRLAEILEGRILIRENNDSAE